MSAQELPPPPPTSPHSRQAQSRRWPTGVAKSIKVLSIIAAVAWGLFGLAIINRISVLEDIQNQNWSNDLQERADSADNFAQSTAGLGICLGVALTILLMVWLFRTTKALRQLGYQTKYAPGWAVGGFFIPIAQFIIVYQMISDCRKAIAYFNGGSIDNRYSVLGWWWGLQAAALLVSRSLVSSDSSDINSMIDHEYLRIGVAAAMTAAVILASISFSRFKEDYERLSNF